MVSYNGTSAPITAVLLLIVANLLIPIAIGIFGKGFFPYKPLLPGLAQYEDGHGQPAPAPFDRVVFMVVDALRSDFVYAANSGFQYTQSLIRSGAAVPFTAHATSPTVTMPRIKAITTGSIPSFLDVVLNVDEGDKSSSLASQDTWLAQMKAKASGKLVLYGDDTWLKLFPETFDRADGTTSFFVSDFTEVDNNVTRHVADELRNDDWSVMVLHYLGLDHIGHKGGPRSPNMIPKQREMDAIVQQIYEGLEAQPHLSRTLLVMCGDHGMNDAGNHGASSAGETSPALVFVAPKLQTTFESATMKEDLDLYRTSPLDERDDFQFYHTVEQSDLAPTLAALLGFPAPKNNLGAFIPDFLPLWPDRRSHVRILLHNAHQILGILTAAFGADAFETTSSSSPDSAAACANPRSDVEELGCEWQAIVRALPDFANTDEANTDAHDEWIARTVKWLRNAQQTMSGMASNYDIPLLGVGLAAAVGALILAIAASYMLLPQQSGGGVVLRVLAPFALINVAYAVMMFASSYVEEEHHFWYWAATAWLALVSLRSLSASSSSATSGGLLAAASVAAAFVAVRLIRGWNQTGQKFAGEPDLVKTFLQPHPLLLWVLVTGTYVWTGLQLVRGFSSAGFRFPLIITGPGVVLLVVSAFAFKLAFTFEDSPELVAGSFARTLLDLLVRYGGGDGVTLITRARIVFAGVAIAAAAVVYGIFAKRRRVSSPPSCQSPLETLLHVYTVLGMTQSRTTNVPLFLLLGVVFQFLAEQQRRGRLRAGPAELATAALLLQPASFFAFGGTNAISSVDLSSAYNGVGGFAAGLVGLLIFVSNWAGSLYWTFAVAVLLVKQQREQRPPCTHSLSFWLGHVALLTVAAASSAAAVMAACAALRTHLFVWTVFSPKYLYAAAWSLGMHLAANVGVGGLLFWLGAYT